MARRKPDAGDFAAQGAHTVGELLLPPPATDEELGITERDLPEAGESTPTRRSLDAILDGLIAYQDTLELATTEEDRAAIEAAIVEHQAALIQKIPRYVGALRRLEFEAQWERDEAARHTKRQRRYEAATKYLEDYAISAMQRRGIRKLEGHGAALKLRQSPGQLMITDESAVPDDYKTVSVTMPRELWIRILKEVGDPIVKALCVAPTREQVTVRKDLAKQAVKGGADVPGVDLVYPDSLVVE